MHEEVFQDKFWLSKFLGIAVAHNEINIIALMNLFIRENKIKLLESKLKEDIYEAKCGIHYSERSPGTYVSFLSYEEYTRDRGRSKEFDDLFDYFDTYETK